jgi:AraC-like DNA-binding protein
MAIVALSYLLSPLIPVDLFRSIIAPVQNTAVITVTFINTWAMFRHSEGLRIRRIFAWIMAALTVLFVVGIGYRFKVNAELRPAEGIFSFEGWELMAGDLIAWLLLAYPAELLRPGWLTFKNALTRVLPVFVIGIIDWFVPWDLRWLLAIVPLVWIVLLFHHLRAYRIYSEENFGSVEQTDEQWVIRYLVMIFVLGCSYAYLCFSEEPNRLFTQQWLLFFILVYTNDQVIFRSKPWIEGVKEEEKEDEMQTEGGTDVNVEYRRALEQWMETEKPYLNPAFRLTDLRHVLPLNRTYLSQFIHAEYDCTFYQFVTNYRIEEAKRLMHDKPDLRIHEIAEQCGFSSPTVFGRVFARETGQTPTEWLAQFDNK